MGRNTTPAPSSGRFDPRFRCGARSRLWCSGILKDALLSEIMPAWNPYRGLCPQGVCPIPRPAGQTIAPRRVSARALRTGPCAARQPRGTNLPANRPRLVPAIGRARRATTSGPHRGAPAMSGPLSPPMPTPTRPSWAFLRPRNGYFMVTYW